MTALPKTLPETFTVVVATEDSNLMVLDRDGDIIHGMGIDYYTLDRDAIEAFKAAYPNGINDDGTPKESSPAAVLEFSEPQ